MDGQYLGLVLPAFLPLRRLTVPLLASWAANVSLAANDLFVSAKSPFRLSSTIVVVSQRRSANMLGWQHVAPRMITFSVILEPTQVRVNHMCRRLEHNVKETGQCCVQNKIWMECPFMRSCCCLVELWLLLFVRFVRAHNADMFSSDAIHGERHHCSLRGHSSHDEHPWVKTVQATLS